MPPATSINVTLWMCLVIVLTIGCVFCTPGHYTPTWAVHIPEGRQVADQVATEHGFINLGEIFGNHYHFHHSKVHKRSAVPSHHHHSLLQNDSRVSWAKQQTIVSRKKRDFLPDRTFAGKQTRAAVGFTKVEGKFYLNDPKWPQMWYLNRGGGLDLNVVPAWREGITGKGVVVTILDDGLESDHPDLIDNYDPNASYDVNSHDANPQPRYDLIDSNRHGTRCAGQVAAVANNSMCAVGVAYGARVGGVRMLDGDVTDAVEARSLSLNPQYVDIYSASWGPDDDGKTVDGPGELATRAFIEGVVKGRSGKGSIFVWASGNGGREKDNCNCDGYTNSIWTLSISAATERGDVPWYSEACSSTLATTYSSGALSERQVVTTDIHHTCTLGHTGTSASAPLAAGICALTLQANPELTWRDMQHIVVRTARPERLSSGTWRTNGVGRNVSSSFGYGLLDAAAMVRTARSWKTVPSQKKCEITGARAERGIPAHGRMSASVRVYECNVKYLEHVVARVSLAASRRGDLRIELVSPAGTRATLLAPRPHDSSKSGFNSWPFMSVHTWGESPIGKWTLEIFNEGKFMGRASLHSWKLIFFGTSLPADINDIQKNDNTTITPKAKIKPTKSRSSKKKIIRPASTSTLSPSIGVTENAASPIVIEKGRSMSGLFSKYNKIQRIYPRPIHGPNNGGSLNKWELVFYGTESATQESDLLDQEGSLADVDNRLNEQASPPARDRDSHQTRDDGRNKELPKLEEERFEESSLSSGCLTSSKPDYCLECVHSLHLYKGKCYEVCPPQTYASEHLTPSVENEKPTIMRRRTVATEVESLMKNRDVMPALSPKTCLPCHYSCQTCNGRYSHQCLTCHNDAQIIQLTNQSFCYPNVIINSHIDLLSTFAYFIMVAIVISTLFVIFRCWYYSKQNDEHLVAKYDKLSTEDTTHASVDIEREITQAIETSSDSEEELHLRL